MNMVLCVHVYVALKLWLRGHSIPVRVGGM